MEKCVGLTEIGKKRDTVRGERSRFGAEARQSILLLAFTVKVFHGHRREAETQ